MDNKITLTLNELEELLVAQKNKTADYITRNLSVYSWFYGLKNLDIDKIKKELESECYRSPFPKDFEVLKKYLK